MPYTIVEFNDGIELIPTNWLHFKDNIQMSYWPPTNDKMKITKHIHAKTCPDKEWVTHEIIKIFCKADNFTRGQEKLKMVEIISDVETSDEASIKKSRHNRHKKTFTSSDEDVSLIKETCLQRRSFRCISDDSDEDLTARTHRKAFNFPTIPESLIQSDKGLEGNEASTSSNSSENLSQDRRTPSSLEFKATNKTSNKGFEALALNQLSLILNKIEDIEKELRNLAPQKFNVSVSEKFDSSEWKKFPLRSVEELEQFEKKLEKDDYYKEMVQALKRIGGQDSQSTTTNILKKLFSNKVANVYSLLGKKGKRAFKSLGAFNLVIDVVRKHHSGATEVEISSIIATWLTQSGLRLAREIDKKQKTKEPTTK